jgi:SAM-dependent methyltransferase
MSSQPPEGAVSPDGQGLEAVVAAPVAMGEAPKSDGGEVSRPPRTVPRPSGMPSRKPTLQGATPSAPPAVEAAPVSDDSTPTERRPSTPNDEPTEGPPEIDRFLSPLPPAPRAESPSGGGEGSGAMRRRSRRTVKIPDDAVPHKAAPPVNVETVPAPERPPISDKPPLFVIPAPPPVPTLTPRSGMPRQSSKPAPLGDEAVRPAVAVPEAEAPPADTPDVIRPMRIISVGSYPPANSVPKIADEEPPQTPTLVSPPEAAPPPAAAAEGEWQDRPRISRPPLMASPELEPFQEAPKALAEPPSTQPVAPPPPKPPVVEEVEAIEDEETEPAAAAPTLRTEEIESIPDDDIVAERPSDVGATPVPEEIPVVVEAPAPKKPPPPPPPPKRPATDGAPAVSQPAPAAQTVDVASRKRQKPWWEEIFSDDYLRTMEKAEPKVIRKECDFIEDRLGLEKGAVMLDLACGSGMHAVELSSRGYNVVGYDLSLAMLARAQDEALDRGQKINFLQGDMREMAFEEAFDGIYCWNTSFGYFEDEKNLNVLSRIRRGLRQGGLFLLDIANRDYICPRQPSLVWFEGDGCVCMDEMHVDFFTSRLKVKRTVMFEDGRARELEYGIRLYGLHELGKMLHETGFKVVEVTGHPAHPGVFFGSESPRIIVLAERA